MRKRKSYRPKGSQCWDCHLAGPLTCGFFAACDEKKSELWLLKNNIEYQKYKKTDALRIYYVFSVKKCPFFLTRNKEKMKNIKCS